MSPMLLALIAVLLVVVGIAVWTMRWSERQIKRDMDRLVFPFYHENRMLRQRLAEPCDELGDNTEER